MPKIADPALLSALNAPVINPTVALDRTYKQGQIDKQKIDINSSQLDPAIKAQQLRNAQLEAQQRELLLRKTHDEMGDGPTLNPLGLQGEDYLKTLPPQRAALVRTIASGNYLPPGLGRSSDGMALLGQVTQFDPTFDGVNYGARAATRKDFTSGKSAQNIKALNTAIGHLGQLNDQIPGTASHGGFPFATTFNSLENSFYRGAGNAGVTNYEQTAGALASELTQVFRGSGGAEADVKRYLGELDSAASDDQKRASIKNIAGLLNSRLSAIGDQYRKGMGTTADPLVMLDDHAQHVMGGLGFGGNGGSDGSGGSGPPNGTPPSNPGGGSGNGVINVEANYAPPASYEQFRTALESKLNSGELKTIDQVRQFAQQNGGFAFPPEQEKNIQAGIDAVKAGGTANVATPVTGGVQAVTGPQAGLDNAANALSFGLLPRIGAAGSAVTSKLQGDPLSISELYGRQLDANRQTLDNSFSDHPWWSAAGTAAGIGTGEGILGAIPGVAKAVNFLPQAARMPAMDGAYAAAMGAGGSDWSNPANVGVNALLSGAAAAAGSKVGGMFANGAGRVLKGVTSPAVNYLRDAGVPLTVGQVTGGPLKTIESSLSSMPIVGDMVRARQRDGFQGFNRAAFDQGLSPIGATTSGTIGPQGVDLARAARSQAYSNTLDPLNLHLDPQFGADFTNAALRGADLPPVMADNAASTLRLRMQDNIGADGSLTGNDFQQSLRGLRRDASSMQSQPYGYDFGQVTDQGEQALRGLVDRQAPDALPAYDAANAANRNVSILQDAVNRARNGTRSGEIGTFTPSQLNDAAAANAKRFDGTQGTTRQPFYELASNGQAVLPSNVPDPGTAGRLATLALPGTLGLGGAGAGYATGDTGKGTAAGLSLGALLTLAGTRGGQRFLTSALIDRPDMLRTVADQVVAARPYAGMFGAGLGTGVASQFLPPPGN